MNYAPSWALTSTMITQLLRACVCFPCLLTSDRSMLPLADWADTFSQIKPLLRVTGCVASHALALIDYFDSPFIGCRDGVQLLSTTVRDMVLDFYSNEAQDITRDSLLRHAWSQLADFFRTVPDVRCVPRSFEPHHVLSHPTSQSS
jgi:hypothetical protein